MTVLPTVSWLAQVPPVAGTELGALERLALSPDDRIWLLGCTALVLVLQIGFMFLEAGTVRSKNAINVALKNLLDLAGSVVCFALVGFMFAFGTAGVLPIGWDLSLFALRSADSTMLTLFALQVLFCGTAATIVSGAVAERLRLPIFAALVFAIASFIYPVFAHWTWGGLLSADALPFLARLGFYDEAGATVVHGTGAWVALISCWMIGPRVGRFGANGEPQRIAGHSAVLATAGALLMFFGWLGFNGGARLVADGRIGVALANTILAGAAGALLAPLLGLGTYRAIHPERMIVGLLGGLVAVTAAPSIMSPDRALLLGLLGCLAAISTNRLLEKLGIDDAVGAIGSHGAAGVIGTLSVALLAPLEHLPHNCRLDQLQAQLLGIGLNAVWACGLGFGLLFVVGRFSRLRVTRETEELGLNQVVHETQLGTGHIESQLASFLASDRTLSTRLCVEKGDDAERLAQLFNGLLENIQQTEHVREQAETLKRDEDEGQRISQLTEATFEAIFMAVDGRIVDGNRALEKLLESEMEHLRGLEVERVWPEVGLHSRVELQTGSLAPTVETTIVSPSGIHIPAEIKRRKLRLRNTPVDVVAIIDLREQLQAEVEMRELREVDPLTKLPNRSQLRAHLGELVANSDSDDESASALLLLNLRRLQEINQLYGHDVGDEVLDVMATRMTSMTLASDFVARAGSDEFAVVRTATNQDQSLFLTHRLINELSRPIRLRGGGIWRPAVCVGIAMHPQDGRKAGELHRCAQAALREANADGRFSYRFYESAMDTARRYRKGLEDDLRTALENRELFFHFQPRLDLATGGFDSFEALLRWKHPKRGMVSPVDFIPVAESSGQMSDLGRFVLEEGCRLAALKFRGKRLSLNVSPLQFRDSDFVSQVAVAIRSSGIDPQGLELELTESALIADDAQGLRTLQELKDLGVQLALDDFGTGYSSLAYLSRFPFDLIKLDRRFTQELTQDRATRSIVETILNLGRTLELRIVAEGVETSDQFCALFSMGCDEIQGFWVAKPQPLETLDYQVPQRVQWALSRFCTATTTPLSQARQPQRSD